MINLSLLYLKRKRRTVIFITISLVLSVALFVTGLSIVGSTNSAVDSMFLRTKAPNILLQYTKKSVDEAELINWLKSSGYVKSLSSIRLVRMTKGDLTYSSNNTTKVIKNLMLNLAEYNQGDDNDITIPSLTLTGSSQERPGYGEVWIPKRVAQIHGIELGGYISFSSPSGSSKLLVTSLTQDPLYNSGFTNPNRVYVAPGELSFIFPLNELVDRELSVLFNPSVNVNQLREDLLNIVGFSGTILDQSLFRSSYTMMFSIVAAILLGIALIAVLISLSLISSSLTQLINSEYKHIGIYKTFGYTPKQVELVFILFLLIISIFSSIMGSFLGYFIQGFVVKSLETSTGVTDSRLPFITSFFLPALLFIPLVSVVTYIKAKAAGKVVPVEAIRYGEPVKVKFKSRLRLRVVGIFFPFTHISLKNIFLNKKGFFTLFSSITLIVISFLFMFNLSYTIKNMGDKIEFWGFAPSDVIVTFVEGRFGIRPDYLEAKLLEDPSVDMVLPSSYIIGTRVNNTKDGFSDVVGDVFWNDMEKAGLLNLVGRHPVAANEISVTWGIKNNLDLNLGDDFKLILEGLPKNYKVTGFYQSVNNMGDGFRIRGKALELLNPSVEPMGFNIKLKSGVDHSEFIDRYKAEYSSAISLTDSKDNYAMISSSGDIIFQSMFALLFILGVIISVVLYNDMYTNISQHSRFFGILKTQGYTPFQLQLILIIKNILVTLMAVPVGIIIGYFISPLITTAITSSMGFVEFPLAFDKLGTTIFVGCLILFMGVSSYFISFKVRYISSRKLIRE